MKVTIIGSHLCPDTLDAISKVYATGAEVEFKDILSCHSALQDYLEIRDTNPLYAEIRGTRRMGVPCFVKEDGTVTLDIHDVI